MKSHFDTQSYLPQVVHPKRNIHRRRSRGWKRRRKDPPPSPPFSKGVLKESEFWRGIMGPRLGQAWDRRRWGWFISTRPTTLNQQVVSHLPLSLPSKTNSKHSSFLNTSTAVTLSSAQTLETVCWHDVCVCGRACMFMCVCVGAHACSCVCVWAHVHATAYVHVCVCMPVRCIHSQNYHSRLNKFTSPVSYDLFNVN